MSFDLQGYDVYQRSVIAEGETTFALLCAKQSGQKKLAVRGPSQDFEGETDPLDENVLVCPLTAANAAALRKRFTWLNPVPLGLRTSAGFGDRLGKATPGHIQALRGSGIMPVFAQQSVRENARTGRTPQEVIDDACWGVFQEAWRESWGADADHLKTLESLKEFAAAGYTFFTIDPGDVVVSQADSDSTQELIEKLQALPWQALRTTWEAMQKAHLERVIKLDGFKICLDEHTLAKAAVKYGRAIAMMAERRQQLVELMGGKPFEMEFSVDETETPTSVEEHFFIVSELRRLKVPWVSLALRFVGRFEKGVDYIGDLAYFKTELQRHTAVMRYYGGYKLSLHSGSDKFSIYPLVSEATRGMVHLKTAGTSYLEALRVLAIREPAFFREILAFGRSHYLEDRVSYHVSAELARAPEPDQTSDAALPALLDQFDTRQILHVTFGSVLDFYGERLHQSLARVEDSYIEVLVKHFQKHLQPFSRRTGMAS